MIYFAHDCIETRITGNVFIGDDDEPSEPVLIVGHDRVELTGAFVMSLAHRQSREAITLVSRHRRWWGRALVWCARRLLRWA